MAAGRIDYRSWLFRVIAWDGMLPAWMIFVPWAIEPLMPGWRRGIEFVAVTPPIAAFFLRLWAGTRFIHSNHCSAGLRAVQVGVFFLGILVLVLVECITITLSLLPNWPGRNDFTAADLVVFGIAISIYLTFMAIAMYPGRSVPSAAEWELGEVPDEDQGVNPPTSGERSW